MSDNCNLKQEIITRLQDDARRFLTHTKIVLKGIDIIPKEIEVYYFKDHVFMDNSVHQNVLQTGKNHNHFYVHRWGISQSDSYKGGNYPGIDIVVSTDESVFYSYLIRSAVINEHLVIGPHKVLENIQNETNLSYNDIEKETLKLEPNIILKDVLFSKRINLGKTVLEEYKDCMLRAVICDDLFIDKESKYPKKEEMITNFLSNANMTKEEALCYAKKHLGYIPSSIK